MKKIILLTNILFLVFILYSCKESTTSQTSSTHLTITTNSTIATTTQTTTNPSCKATNYVYDAEQLDYQLVWNDEFDENELDLTKWGYDVGGSGFGNNELQYYTNGSNLSIENGILTIEARNEQFNQREYTSSKITTRNKANWLYGKFEVRAKLPSGRGTWPAVWMMPTGSYYGTWPRSGEIDIMEHVGYDMNRVHGSVHTSRYNHKNNTQKSGTVFVSDVDSEYHVYTMEWLPDQINYYVDGKFYYRFKPSNFVECPTFAEWPFDRSFYLILNVAVGGDWGGARGIDDSIWPQSMEIDYVRVYQSELITNMN